MQYGQGFGNYPCRDNVFSLQVETFLPAGRKHYLREDKDNLHRIMQLISALHIANNTIDNTCTQSRLTLITCQGAKM